MKPILFYLPILGWSVKGYGLMLMIGFLLSVYLATRRAAKLRANPDVVLNVGFVALICGVAGARLWYYIQYYPEYYSRQPWWALFDVTSGGLTFYGGFLLGLAGIVVYLRKKRVSLRLYLDILAPSVMLGLAFGRIGCFLNGCCFGDVCADDHNKPRLPWTVTFPYASPSHSSQWQQLQTSVPKELIIVPGLGWARLINRDQIYRPPTTQQVEQINQITDPRQKSRKRARYADILDQSEYYAETPQQLAGLAAHYRSLPVQPAQLYGSINALMISVILCIVLARRRRHGVVVSWFLILYGISRFILEQIRADNPHVVWIFTPSQAASIILIVLGLIWLAVLRRLPPVSPRAVPYVPPNPD